MIQHVIVEQDTDELDRLEAYAADLEDQLTRHDNDIAYLEGYIAALKDVFLGEYNNSGT